MIFSKILSLLLDVSYVISIPHAEWWSAFLLVLAIGLPFFIFHWLFMVFGRYESISKHLKRVFSVYFGFFMLDEGSSEKKGELKVRNMLVMILVRNLPHVSIKIFEFFGAGYTHNWKARTGLTSPSLVLNYYLLNDSI